MTARRPPARKNSRNPSAKLKNDTSSAQPHLSKVMMGCRKARVTIFDTNKGAMVLITARGHALSLHQDSFAEHRSALGSRIVLSPRLMLKSL